MPQRWLGVRGSLSFKGLIFGASGLFNFLKYVKYREMSYLSNMILICKCQLPNRPGLSLTRGWGWGGGGNTDKPNHIPKNALRPHNPKPEAVQSQTSPKGLRPPARSSAIPNIPKGLRLPARSSAIPNMLSSSQSQTLNLTKTGSPKQCNPKPSSKRRPAEAVQSRTLNLKKTGCPKQFTPTERLILTWKV